MAKKSFKDNPALHFITQPGSAPKPSAVSKARPASVPPSEVPLKPNPLYVETKSKRVQLLMQPSLHAKLKALAAGRGQSLNDLVHNILGEWAEKES